MYLTSTNSDNSNLVRIKNINSIIEIELIKLSSIEKL